MEIKYYNVVTEGKTFFSQSIKNDLKTYDNSRMIATVQGDDYTTGSLLDYSCFKKYHKLIAIDLSKQQKLDPVLKAIQKINFTGNLPITGGNVVYSIVEEVKESALDFSKGIVQVLLFHFALIKH